MHTAEKTPHSHFISHSTVVVDYRVYIVWFVITVPCVVRMTFRSRDCWFLETTKLRYLHRVIPIENTHGHTARLKVFDSAHAIGFVSQSGATHLVCECVEYARVVGALSWHTQKHFLTHTSDASRIITLDFLSSLLTQTTHSSPTPPPPMMSTLAWLLMYSQTPFPLRPCTDAVCLVQLCCRCLRR